MFGLVSHGVPTRNGSNMTSSGRTKAEAIEWCWEEQSCFKGARAKASADVLEIRIWEVNTSNWEGKGGRKEGREVSGWEGNSQWKEGSNSNMKRR